jgi:hypothetical protein
MAFSDHTIKKLAIAITEDVINDIFLDERYTELLMEIIPECVSMNLQCQDVDLVTDISMCVMDNIIMKARKTNS